QAAGGARLKIGCSVDGSLHCSPGIDLGFFGGAAGPGNLADQFGRVKSATADASVFLPAAEFDGGRVGLGHGESRKISFVPTEAIARCERSSSRIYREYRRHRLAPTRQRCDKTFWLHEGMVPSPLYSGERVME